MTNKQAYAGLLERLRLSTLHPFVEGGNTLERVTLNNPDGPEAAEAISSLLKALEELERASSQVFDGLNARIDAACASGGDSVPVFAGLAALSDALHTARAALNSDAPLSIGEEQ